ncbi:MAG: cysteine hydrolase [Thermotogae bacterium]|nr:cysteine hydrolase [Thermotogota bacterium]
MTEYKVHERVELPAKGSAVVVVDMQNDFVHPNGTLFVPDAPKTVPAIVWLLNKARDSEIPIFYTQDWHGEEDPEFEIWGKHAVADTWGAEIVSELKPQEGDTLIKKLRYDGFYGTPLDHMLRLKGVNTLVIVGTVANICVLHTAGSAALRWYRVVVPMDGISALNEGDFHFTLKQIDFLYRGLIARSVRDIEFV